MFANLRRRIEQSPLLAQAGGRSVAAWTGLCLRTSQWQRQGDAEMAAAVAQGPVMVVLWHEMLMMGAAHWRPAWGPLASLHDSSPAGRAGALAQARLGAQPFLIAPRQSNFALAREVLALIRGGSSLAVAADGPRGPYRVLHDPTIDWARAAGVPIFAYAWAITRPRRAQSWDRMILARPRARGAVVFRPWDREIPRRIDAAAREALRADLAAHLTATADAARALAED